MITVDAMLKNRPKKLTRSVSSSDVHFNCFGSFDGLHNLILGKFRFGLELKRSKSICENGLMLIGQDKKIDEETYFPRLPDIGEQSLRRAVSHQDLRVVTDIDDGNLLTVEYSAKKHDEVMEKSE